MGPSILGEEPDRQPALALQRLGVGWRWIDQDSRSEGRMPQSSPPSSSKISTRSLPQTKSASYRLPVEDPDFLHRDEMRGIRLQLEYEKPEILLREWGVRSTIIVFGSARTPSPERARAMRKAAGGDLEPKAEAQLQKHLA